MKTSLGMLVFLSVAPLLATADVVVPIDSVESYVNIRMEPDAGSEIVGRLQQGEDMQFVKSVSGWHEVSLEGGGSGFIHEDWAIVISELDENVAEVVTEVESVDSAVQESVEPKVAADEAPVEQTVADAEVSTEAVEEIADDGVEEFPVEAVEEPSVVAGEETVEEPAAEPVAEEVEVIVADSNEDAATETIDDGAQDTEAVTDDEQSQVAAVTETATDDSISTIVPVLVGPAGPGGATGPPGPPGAATVKGSVDYLMKFTGPKIGGNSQIFDDGRNIGIGTDSPKQRLEVNGNIQIHEQNSNVAGIMLTQSSGETGYIMHNRASTLTIGAGSVDRITIDRDGYVGIGISRPGHPIEMASGAYVSAGGVWTNSSSIERKENISDLTPEEALRALADLEPVHFNYKQDIVERHIGFIAEDVPDLVATADRKGLSTMDIVAVLTKVVQMQQQKIDELEARINE